MIRDAVIVGAVRTPVGRRKGGLAGVHPVDLSGHVLRALAERCGLDPADVDDLHWGCVSQVGEQSWNVGRNAVLAAGWPESIPGTTIDRQCGSSQQAVHSAAAAVIAGQADLVVAGGVESMTRVPMGASVGADAGTPYGERVRERYAGREGFDTGAPVPFSQGQGAEMIARLWGFDRARLDGYALDSHVRAAAAQDEGAFAAEIVPTAGLHADEGVRRDTSLARLGELPTPFRPDGVVTAGSAVAAADDPVIMLTAPIPATARALRRAGLTLSDIGVYEVNEAFAPVPLAWLAETGADPERLNPQGGAIALGHPLGGSGARIMTTLLHHMSRHGVRYGLQTMCEGGGMANATILELL
jgi:acetyl-CoA acyltransferase